MGSRLMGVAGSGRREDLHLPIKRQRRVNRITAHGFETESVHGRRSEAPDSRHMLRTVVTLVVRQSVLRVEFVPLTHHLVTVDFGEDGSGGNGMATFIALNEGLLGHRDVQ